MNSVGHAGDRGEGSAVDVWYVAADDVRDPSVVRACTALLTDEERIRHAAFVFEKHRHEYLVTRALVRAVLASYVGVAPSALAFVRNEYGRPTLTPPGRVRFNLTNTVELVACGVAHDCEVGIDAEPLSRADNILALRETVFTKDERDALDVLPVAERRRRAVAMWTLKEAYIKARGMGMSLPVERLHLTFDALGDIHALSFLEPVVDTPSRWSLSTHAIGEHLLSVCVEAPSRPAVVTRRADLGALLARAREG
jgi:4'-phosphopantetheinyl transferase